MSDDEKRIAYQVVAARHAGWDNLLWQIPVLSMTAQAFLFSISLSPGSTPLARIIASLLSLLTLFLSATSMARQRQGSLTDAKWLASVEQGWEPEDKQYGEVWATRRDRQSLDAGWLGDRVPRLRMFRTWVAAFAIFGMADLGIMVVAIWYSELLTGVTPAP